MAKSPAVKKGFITFLFPNFSRIQLIERLGILSLLMRNRHLIFFPPCFRAVLCQTQRGRVAPARLLFSATSSALN